VRGETLHQGKVALDQPCRDEPVDGVQHLGDEQHGTYCCTVCHAFLCDQVIPGGKAVVGGRRRRVCVRRRSQTGGGRVKGAAAGEAA
jgi:hypothetical protein